MAQAKTVWVDFKEIKARVSIVQILERYGALESLAKSGNGDRLSGACPIHGGTNKTHFRVSVSKNCWNCFGTCHCGGNVIDFVAKKEDVPFRDAALLIDEWFPAGESGNAEPSEKPRFDRSKIDEKSRFQTPAPPAEKPREEPEDETPNKPLSFGLTKLDPAHPYLKERGLSDETISLFGLGYCGKGSIKGHIAIPIHNPEGEIVGYAGRFPGVPEEGKGKYKLPKGFKKSVEIFNIHRALASEDDAPIVVVEGFFDVMKLHQEGYSRVAALMGSSLSKSQEEMLYRLCKAAERIILFFDNDEAGQKGQAEALKRLAKRLYVRAIDLGDRKAQPEDLSADELRQLLPFQERRTA
jgi:DNA primase